MNSFVFTSAGHEAKKDPQKAGLYRKRTFVFRQQSPWVARYNCNDM